MPKLKVKSLTAVLGSLVIAGSALAFDPTQPPEAFLGDNIFGLQYSQFLKLNMILTRDGKRVANISGKILMVGDKINGKTVTQITKQGVELIDKEGETTSLSLVRKIKNIKK